MLLFFVVFLLKLRSDSFLFTKERPLKTNGIWDVFVSTLGLSLGKPMADEAGGGEITPFHFQMVLKALTLAPWE